MGGRCPGKPAKAPLYRGRNEIERFLGRLAHTVAKLVLQFFARTCMHAHARPCLSYACRHCLSYATRPCVSYYAPCLPALRVLLRPLPACTPRHPNNDIQIVLILVRSQSATYYLRRHDISNGTRTYTYVHPYIHAFIHSYIHDIHTCMYACMHACTHIFRHS